MTPKATIVRVFSLILLTTLGASAQQKKPNILVIMTDDVGVQVGKNHLGDRNEFLPTVHGFDEFYGNLYHLNAEEEPEDPDTLNNLPFTRNSVPVACSVASR